MEWKWAAVAQEEVEVDRSNPKSTLVAALVSVVAKHLPPLG